MGGEELRELEASLSGAGRVCKHLRSVSLVCMVVFFVACALLLAHMVVVAATEGFDAEKMKGLSYVALYGVVILWLLFVAFRSFSDVVNGESPFTMKQVARFKRAAILLLVLSVIDAFLSTGFVYGFDIEGIEFAALGNRGIDQPHIHVNAIALFFAVVMYGVSALFKYGVLLQRLTDETE